jgi:hypothetical protein
MEMFGVKRRDKITNEMRGEDGEPPPSRLSRPRQPPVGLADSSSRLSRPRQPPVGLADYQSRLSRLPLNQPVGSEPPRKSRLSRLVLKLSRRLPKIGFWYIFDMKNLENAS